MKKNRRFTAAVLALLLALQPTVSVFAEQMTEEVYEETEQMAAETVEIAKEGEAVTRENEKAEKTVYEYASEDILEEDSDEEEPSEETAETEDGIFIEESSEEDEDIVLNAEAEDGMQVTLTAEAGTFGHAAGLRLQAAVAEEKNAKEAGEALETETKDDNVAKRVTYDIKVMCEDEELEPVEGSQVQVSFAFNEVPSGADAVSIYHHEGDGDIETIVDKASIEDGGDAEIGNAGASLVVKGVTDGFSYYTVDFTYEDKEISIPGDTEGTPLEEILSAIGIKGSIAEAIAYQDAECTVKAEDGEVTVDGKVLFRVYETDGIWYVDAVNAFDTEHGLAVKTADGAEYKIKVTDDTTPNYLTFTAQEDKSWVKFSWCGGSNVMIKGPGDDDFKSYTAGTQIDLNNGQSVQFKGSNIETRGAKRFSMNGKIAASGDVTSLTNGTGGKATLTGEGYQSMFQGCTSLTTAPALPSETLINYCYQYMFQGCTSLKTAPTLPATTLKDYCYNQMFKDCTSLEAATTLPATTLTYSCYFEMFRGCTSLEAAPALPATTLATNCYCGMFNGCTSLKAAPALPTTSLSDKCYNSMFKGCTSLEAAPALPAATLKPMCYQDMFSGCTSLEVSEGSGKTEIFTCPDIGSLKTPVTDMFAGTGGTFTGTPTKDKTYYYGGFTVTCATPSNGTLSADKTTASAGETITITATPSEGYALDNLTAKDADEGTVTITDNTFTMPASNVTVTATFKEVIKYTVTYNSNGATSGTVPSDTAEYSGNASVTVSGNTGSLAKTGYTFAGWNTKADGTGTDRAAGSTFNITEDTILYAKWTETNYLTFTAQEDKSWVKFSWCGGSNVMIKGPGDDDFKSYTAGTQIDLNNGQSVQFKGSNIETRGAKRFSMNGKIAASGDVTSLTNGTGGKATLTGEGYQSMFQGCTSLETAPTLPATTLLSHCYEYMFQGCTSLKAAPTLPATTLKDYCYNQMFKDCTSLEAAPTLPATTLDSNCYSGMFKGCTSLETAPALQATTLASNCYQFMFQGCTSLEAAPALPATALKNRCYKEMFQGCTSLKVSEGSGKTEIFTCPDTSAADCVTDMFAGTGGTFTGTPTKDKTYYYGGFTVTCATPSNGTLSADKTTASAGETITITATPSEGYALDTLTVKDVDEGTVPITDNTFTMPASNVTVTATFKEVKYTVTYNSNGATSGTVPSDTAEYSGNASVTVSGNTGSLAKTGYTFAGWNTKADGTGTDRAAGSTFNITADTTLYAKWKQNLYTVTFDAQGHGTAPESQKVVEGGLVAEPAAPTATGYAFGGWYKEAACTTKWNFESNTVTAATTLYAKWGNECKIGDTIYATLQEAVDAVKVGETIKLTSDIDLTATIIVENTRPAFTLDLNGHVLNAGNIDEPDNVWDNASVIWNKGKLTITDSNPTSIHTQTSLNDIKGGVLTGGKGHYTFENGTAGGAIYNEGELNLSGGTIFGNKASAYGGGVYNHGNAAFTMTGGMISGNTAHSGGGVLNRVTATFTMTGGSITKNSSTRNGGGIYNYGILSVKDGKITNNTASNIGGGIINWGSLTLNGASITGNTSDGNCPGGGVYNWQPEGKSDASVTISGKVTIKDNKTNGKAANLCLSGETEGDKILIDVSGITGSKIGVTTMVNDAISPLQFTTAGVSSFASCFTSDNEGYAFTADSSGALKLVTGYAVSFDANGHGTAPKSQTVAIDEKATKPTDPTAVGYTFGGWYKEAGCTTKWDFANDTVSAATTLYAKWTQVSSQRSSSSGRSEVTTTSYGTGSRKTPASGTWKKNSKGQWTFGNKGNAKFTNTWGYIKNSKTGSAKWYYFDKDGVMQTGWQTINGKKYYFCETKNSSEGVMETGWKKIGGKWYYFSRTKDGNEGALLTNTTTPDGYKVDANGVWIQK